ncbi:MAG: hypothetical protein JST54_05115 [Deltaproteobacteria bacterium]|nr:hypothetical protein [Deltaproteobacteria bacterium]
MRTFSRSLFCAFVALAACGKDQKVVQTNASSNAANGSGTSGSHGSTGGSETGATGGSTTGSSGSHGASTGSSGSHGSTTASSAAASTGSSGSSGTSTSSTGSSGATSGSSGSSTGGTTGSIDHLVIIVLENHTFDSMFAKFPGAEGKSHFVFDGGVTIDAQPAPDAPSHDMCHAHSCALADWNNGAMDGWVNNGDQQQYGDFQAFSQYDGSSIPGFWALASNYGLADHYFSSMLGPSFPGHTFLLAAQAGGALDNPSANLIFNSLPLWGCDDPSTSTVDVEPTTGNCGTSAPFPCFNIPSAPDTLQSQYTWKFYGTGLNFLGTSIVWSMFDAIKPIHDGSEWGNVVTYDQFEQDIQNGTLPNVTWLVDQDLNSGHPPFSMCSSDTWATHYTNDIINSPYWDHAAVIITWDDFGGWYDHVPPPTQYGCDLTHPYGLGFRLPAIIVSPWVKHGVFHGVTEQASIPRLIEELFGAPGAVGTLHRQDARARDDVAGSLLDAFDFSQQPLPANPATESCP